MLSDKPEAPPLRRSVSDIRPDASYPDPMGRPDGGPRLPDNPHAGGLLPEVVPPLPRENPYARRLPWRTAFS